MTTVTQLVTPLQAEVLVTGAAMARQPVSGVVASDLMSDVLVVSQDDVLLVTSLASDQMIRTADLVGAVGVIVVNAKPLAPSLIRLAESLDIALLRTALPKYEACLAIGAYLATATEPES